MQTREERLSPYLKARINGKPFWKRHADVDDATWRKGCEAFIDAPWVYSDTGMAAIGWNKPALVVRVWRRIKAMLGWKVA